MPSARLGLVSGRPKSLCPQRSLHNTPVFRPLQKVAVRFFRRRQTSSCILSVGAFDFAIVASRSILPCSCEARLCPGFANCFPSAIYVLSTFALREEGFQAPVVIVDTCHGHLYAIVV